MPDGNEHPNPSARESPQHSADKGAYCESGGRIPIAVFCNIEG